MALVVIAEDDYLVALVLAEILRNDGHQVEWAPDGKTALQLLQEKKPDLLISDYMMPLMNGAELAEAVRKDDELKRLPVLLVSGAQSHIAQSRPELFSAVVGKPYEHGNLLEIVRRLLGGGGGAEGAGEAVPG